MLLSNASALVFIDSDIEVGITFEEKFVIERGHTHMTSAKFSDFLTPYPLSAFSSNLPY